MNQHRKDSFITGFVSDVSGRFPQCFFGKRDAKNYLSARAYRLGSLVEFEEHKRNGEIVTWEVYPSDFHNS